MEGGMTMENIGNFLKQHGGSEQAKATLLGEVFPFLKDRGVVTTFLLGFCWGGRIALEAAADDQISANLHASAGLHAALRDEAAAIACGRNARIPMMLLQGGNDP